MDIIIEQEQRLKKIIRKPDWFLLSVLHLIRIDSRTTRTAADSYLSTIYLEISQSGKVVPVPFLLPQIAPT